MTRVWIALALLGAARAAAHADGTITWDAPDGCPDADAVRAQVAVELGRDPAPGDVDVELRVARDGAGWHLEMTTAGGGERTLEAASCEELAQSAALIVAMAIDAAAAETGGFYEPPAPGGSMNRPVAPRRQVDISEPAPRTPTDVQVRARAFVVGDLGTMPGAAVGAGGAIEVALDAWGIEVAAARFGAQRSDVPGEPGNGAEMAVTTIATRLCYTSRPRRLATSGCAGAEIEIVDAAGYGFDVALDHTTTFGGGLQLGVAWAYRLVGPIAARVDVLATALLVRPVLIEEDGTVIHDPNVLVWRGVAGIEATW